MDELLEEMIDPAPSRQDVARRRRLWATGAVLTLAAVGITSLTTSALFTDQDALNGSISTGTVVLTADGARFTMPVGGLAPGGTVVAPLTVDNVGSLQLRYAISLSAEQTTPASGTAGPGDLRTQLRAQVLEDPVCTVESSATARVLGATSQSPLEFGLPTTLVPIVGDPSTGAQTGDRELGGVTAGETLCVRVDMSLGADNDYQNTAAELTFQLDSEQTVNN